MKILLWAFNAQLGRFYLQKYANLSTEYLANNRIVPNISV